jgi:hypothetical protein
MTMNKMALIFNFVKHRAELRLDEQLGLGRKEESRKVNLSGRRFHICEKLSAHNLRCLEEKG